MWQKLKSLILEDQVFYGLLIILVGGVSFLLGRFSTPEMPQPASEKVQFSKDTALAEQLLPPVSDLVKADAEGVIASKTGTKYHRRDCPGAKQIKPENQISFASVAAAMAAGYTPANNCPGLK